MLKTLVTGAGGFVGSELVRFLSSKGYQVSGLVRSDASAELVKAAGGVPVFGDVTDRSSIAAALKGVGTVYHIAALFRAAGFPPSEFHRVNFEGTKNIIDCSAAAGVERVIYCSTVGVHGHIENPPADETCPYAPGDPYQISKRDAEELFLTRVSEGVVKGSVVRPAMIYGPNDTRTLKLFKRIAQRRFAYVGDGSASVHFIDVRDLARGFESIGSRNDLNGEVFILAGESAMPLREMVGIISALIGVPEPRIKLPVKPIQLLGSLCEGICVPFGIEPPIFRRRVDFFTKDRSFNCTKAKQILNFEPQQHVVGELIDIINSYLDTGAIDASSVRRPSAMLRTIEGRIDIWDEEACRTYGWNKNQAIGNVSHSLLGTKFPDDISRINSELQKNGRWRGPLVHKSNAGSEIEVESTWHLIKSRRDAKPMVLEVNLPKFIRRRLNSLRQSVDNLTLTAPFLGAQPIVSALFERRQAAAANSI